VDKGRISEIGTHDEIMANPMGHYKKLYDLQDLSLSSPGQDPETDDTKKDHDIQDINVVLEDVKKEKAEDDRIEISKQEEKTLAKKASLFGRDDYGWIMVGLLGALATGIMVGPTLNRLLSLSLHT
jgi:hypothetical protein